MHVIFYGDFDSLKTWKDLVIRTTKKKCDDIRLKNGRHLFVAHINELDCLALLPLWHQVEMKEVGPGMRQGMSWNCRVSFKKVGR